MKRLQSRKRQENRLRLRSWLKRQIESGEFDGLQWIDREKQIFRVPWKHGSRQNWSLDRDACLFQGWALYTGKYKIGRDKPDPKRWKTNFRCALNALPDIEHLPEEDSTQGQDAYRVYVMMPKNKKRKDKQRKQAKVQRTIDVPVLTPPPSSESETDLSDQEVPSEDEIIQIVDEMSTGLDESGMHLFNSSLSTNEADLLPLGIIQQISQYPQTQLPLDWYLHLETDKVRVEKSVLYSCSNLS